MDGERGWGFLLSTKLTFVVTQMSVDDVCYMVKDMGLDDKMFRHNLVDGPLLLTLSNEEMQEDLSLTRLQARKLRMKIDDMS